MMKRKTIEKYRLEILTILKCQWLGEKLLLLIDKKFFANFFIYSHYIFF